MKELRKNAEEIGFKSQFDEALSYVSSYVGRDILIFKLTSHDHLWMCELQQWLRDNYNFHIHIEVAFHDGVNYMARCNYKVFDFFASVSESDEWISTISTTHKTYEESLKKILIEVLNKIKQT